MLRALLKIWPAFTPLALYLLWVFIMWMLRKKPQKKDYIEGEFQVLNNQKIPYFSLKNRDFILVLYATLVIAILMMLYTAYSNKPHQYPSATSKIDQKIEDFIKK